MTLPTTSVSLSAIQTEFGGSNPVSMSEYYAGGAYVNSNQATSGTDGSAVAGSGAIRIGTFRGLTKTTSGGIGTSWYNTYNEGDRVASGTVSVTLTFLANGTITAVASGALGTSIQSDGKSWYTPTTTSIGTNYWIRATLQSGTGFYSGATSTAPSTGTMGTWTQMSSDLLWRNSATASLYASSVRYSLIKFEISTNSSGTNIVASGNIGIEAAKDTGS